jgi:hypothetical protein
MTNPYKTLIWMTAFLIGGVVALTFVYEPLHYAFQSNPWFNGVILAILGIGILYSYAQVGSLYREIGWIEDFRGPRQTAAPNYTTPLLAPMARMLERKESDLLTLSPSSTRSILDSVSNRLAESRDISRYFIGLLIFLGLLGTFWGLLVTVSSVSDVIQAMSIDSGDSSSVFANLKAGLQQPLSGMGIAFSSSLFGLAGSLMLGFLDLQAGHAQRRFFNELEEWLSGVTRLSSGSALGDGEVPVPAYVQALLEQTADGLDRLQRALETQGTERRQLDDAVFALTTQIAELGQHVKHGQQAPLPDELRQELRLLSRTIGAAMNKK